MPQFERIAWREGKRAAQRLERSAARAFLQGARQSLRIQDLLAHDLDSDVFIAATLGAPRRCGPDRPTPAAMDCRAALGRIAAGMSAATGLCVETGWTLVRKMEREPDIDAEIAAALERGLRERERYEFFATVGHELRTPLTRSAGISRRCSMEESIPRRGAAFSKQHGAKPCVWGAWWIRCLSSHSWTFWRLRLRQRTAICCARWMQRVRWFDRSPLRVGSGSSIMRTQLPSRASMKTRVFRP